MSRPDRLAIVLFNLGGPDSPQAVKPFLKNLFNDPAILGLPRPFRSLLAWLIASKRAPVARAIYARIGGASPLLPETLAQAAALDAVLSGEGVEARSFVAMRYWHPFSDEAARAVKEWSPDRIVLLPLYPHYSKTTTGSSLKAWRKSAAAAGLEAETAIIDSYPCDKGLVEAQADLIRAALEEVGERPVRLLFSAHGLPKSVIAKGDPYQRQIEENAGAIVALLDRPGLDWGVCYQSRVGPVEWIGPATDDEIRRAGGQGLSLVVVPIAFVSEHSETLVELDLEYGELAHRSGVPVYRRVPAVGTHPAFIAGLAGLVRNALTRPC